MSAGYDAMLAVVHCMLSHPGLHSHLGGKAVTRAVRVPRLLLKKKINFPPSQRDWARGYSEFSHAEELALLVRVELPARPGNEASLGLGMRLEPGRMLLTTDYRKVLPTVNSFLRVNSQ